MKKNYNTLASRARYRMTLQTPVDTPDLAGGYTRTWSDTATFWTEIVPLRAREQVVDGRQQQKTTHRITCRYRADITNIQRLKYGTRLFNIRSVENVDERNEKLEMLVEEGVAS